MISGPEVSAGGSKAETLINNRMFVLRLADAVGNLPEAAFIIHAYRTVLNRDPEWDLTEVSTRDMSSRVRYLAELFTSTEATLLYRGDRARAARAFAVVHGQSAAIGVIETLIVTSFESYDLFVAGLPALAEEVVRNTITAQIAWLEQPFDPATQALQLAQRLFDNAAAQAGQLAELDELITALGIAVRDMRAAALKRQALPESSIDDALSLAARLADDYRRVRS